jgi:RNA polymerase sigma-70 factor (ECF subfamily)
MLASSDEALVKRIADGDRMAMQVLFTRHNVRVFRFILRIVRNDALADELIGDTFLDVWLQAGRFEFRSSVPTWLMGIARYKALSALRRRTHESLDEAAETIEDEADDPEILEQKRGKALVLRDCINALSRDHREIVDLVYYFEKSIEEVAALVGIPENTVKTRLFHARKRLSEMAASRGLDRGWP